ncbi:MAG: DegT/DnrJ/EryC1/StrS family aminotransferase [Acidobacteriaceae bacterium]|nr:DegT/DnrJ/EryC1/StrS family aminotransferase [Acidobacteriaceae bacterium]
MATKGYQTDASSAVMEPAPVEQDATGLYTSGFHFRRGRIALCAILRALEIGQGDEVIIQAFTCVALPVPVLAVGATPVFADIQLSTLNLDPSSVEARITPRTKAIVVQHTFGIPADMDAILRIASKRGIYVIEDCCHTMASSYNGTLVGHMGDAAFSAYRWGKPLVLGIGGTANIRAEGPRKRLEAISRSSRIPGGFETMRTQLEYLVHHVALRPSTFWFLRDGYRSFIRMGVAIPTFPKLELRGELTDLDVAMPLFHQRWLAKRIRSAFDDVAFRKRRASYYAAALTEMGARIPRLDARYDPVFLRYPFLTSEKGRILDEARKHRIELGDWFVSALHPHRDSEAAELGYRQGMCPAAEIAGREILTLPIYDKVRDQDARRAVDMLDRLHAEGMF